MIAVLTMVRTLDHQPDVFVSQEVKIGSKLSEGHDEARIKKDETLDARRRDVK
jgi:hypothetical protein